MDVASLMAAHWMSTDSSAACRAGARSLENVAMPHCRGGQVATNATDKLRSSARFGCLGASDGILVMCYHRSRLSTQPIQDVSNLCGPESNARVGRSVVHAQVARSTVEHRSTLKNHIGNVTRNLIRLTRTNHPFVSASQDPARVVQVEQCEPNAVQRTSRCITYAMVDNQPSVNGLDRLRRQADFARVPPGTVTRFEQYAVIAPVMQIRRKRQPHVGFRAAAVRHRTMDQRPPTAELSREEGRVLVFGRHDRTVALEGAKVLRRGQRNQGSRTRICRVGHREIAQALETHNAGVFHTQQLS